MRLRVLVESPLSAPTVVGTSCRYAPVELPADAAPIGEFADIVAGESCDGRIRAGAADLAAC
jgi:hypothetical protein